MTSVTFEWFQWFTQEYVWHVVYPGFLHLRVLFDDASGRYDVSVLVVDGRTLQFVLGAVDWPIIIFTSFSGRIEWKYSRSSSRDRASFQQFCFWSIDDVLLTMSSPEYKVGISMDLSRCFSVPFRFVNENISLRNWCRRVEEDSDGTAAVTSVKRWVSVSSPWAAVFTIGTEVDSAVMMGCAVSAPTRFNFSRAAFKEALNWFNVRMSVFIAETIDFLSSVSHIFVDSRCVGSGKFALWMQFFRTLEVSNAEKQLTSANGVSVYHKDYFAL